jgi:hypothetical protein
MGSGGAAGNTIELRALGMDASEGTFRLANAGAVLGMAVPTKVSAGVKTPANHPSATPMTYPSVIISDNAVLSSANVMIPAVMAAAPSPHCGWLGREPQMSSPMMMAMRPTTFQEQLQRLIGLIPLPIFFPVGALIGIMVAIAVVGGVHRARPRAKAATTTHDVRKALGRSGVSTLFVYRPLQVAQLVRGAGVTADASTPPETVSTTPAQHGRKVASNRSANHRTDLVGAGLPSL